jgi:hypothetical protein
MSLPRNPMSHSLGPQISCKLEHFIYGDIAVFEELKELTVRDDMTLNYIMVA